ncbi:MAG: UDP-3-O-(3-hydroxymyristoyl)glucosamine N-acyltransferase [Alphaproteobacteria bacterium]|nr:UDP-3-O-(3-hydroxymyristoyl)glucosamine N-acyltransferase [Alphaproteobacteria bacterium]
MADPRFFSQANPLGLAELVEITGAAMPEGGDASRQFVDVAPLDSAGPEHVSFFENRKYLEALANSSAGAIIISETVRARAPKDAMLLVVDEPYRAYAKVASTFHPLVKVEEPGIAPGSHVADGAVLGPGCQVDPGAVIHAGARLGQGCRVRANAVIGKNVEIGDECDIGASASLSHCLIGNRVILHPGVCIGQDGYGFAMSAEGHEKVPQLGRVVIEDDVEIGANSAIDRGAGPDTLIGAGCKIDNLVQIGHNVHLGPGCVVVAQVGISGSTEIGAFAVMAGQVGIAGHLKIGAGATIAAKSGVARDIPAGATMGGIPAQPVREWRRSMAAVAKLGRTTGRKGG